MDPLNPIPPERDPVIPLHLLPAIQRISPEQQRDESQEEPARQESEEAEEESFEHLLDEVVDDDCPSFPDGHTGPRLISDAVMVSGAPATPVTEPTVDLGWEEQVDPERRSEDHDDEAPGGHIDITA
jgi:hypothetical protein